MIFVLAAVFLFPAKVKSAHLRSEKLPKARRANGLSFSARNCMVFDKLNTFTTRQCVLNELLNANVNVSAVLSIFSDLHPNRNAYDTII